MAALWIGLLWAPAFGQTKIFVASSLLDLAQKLGEEIDPQKYIIVGGASSTLARQIKAGAPAALFISAHKEWAEFVSDGQTLQPIMSNRLVLVSNNGQQVADIKDLSSLLKGKRLAIADPFHVPAGKYAQEALEYFGVWSELKSQLAPADNVRAAAHLVRSNVLPFGIVYASDAKALGLHIAYAFPQESHSEVQYWAVEFDKNNEDIAAFLSFFKSEKAAPIIAQFGFEPYEVAQ